MARKPRKHRGARPALKSEGWWDRLPDRTQHIVCLLALVVTAVLFYAPAVFTSQTIVGGDTVNWRAMAEHMIDYRAEAGEEPLWAPNTFGGMPGYMINYPTQIFQVDDLATWMRPAIWPVSHLLFLLLGTYLLVVYLTRDKLAAVLSSLAFGWTTYLPVLLVAGHNSKFISLSFAPWLILGFAYVLRRPTLLSSLLFAAALAANLRAGHVQITYYIAFLLGIWWLVELVAAVRRNAWKDFARTTGWLALGSVLGLLLVAQPYLANYQYKEFTIRGATEGGGTGLDWEYATQWSQGIGELVTLIAADAFGGAGQTYWGPKPFTAGPHYVGAIVLLLAILAVWRRPTKLVLSLAAGTVVIVLFSLGHHLPSLNRLMYGYFPLFDAFRVPETWLSIGALALAVLAGIGLSVAGRDDSEAGRRAVFVSAGVVAGLLVILMISGDILFDYERPNEEQMIVEQVRAQRPDLDPADPGVQTFIREYLAEQKEERQSGFTGSLFRSLIFVLLAGGLLVAYRQGKIPRWTMQAAIALLVIIDLWSVDRRYLNQEHYVDVPDVSEQIATYDFDQFIMERQEEAGGPGHFRVLSLESGNPFTNARPSYHYESIGGYHGAKLRLIQNYIDEIFPDPETRLPNENALDLLNVRYIVARGTLPGTDVVYQGDRSGLYVLRNQDAVPRAYFVGETEQVDSPEQAWSRIQSADFDPRETALLLEPIDFEPTPVDSASAIDVELRNYSPREISWNVTTDAPRLLVVSEIYYPAGWTATVDGEEVPIHRVNYLLRGVPVPAGDHHVVMRFEPVVHTAGLWISGITTIFVYGLAIGLIGRNAYRRRRRSHEPVGAAES